MAILSDDYKNSVCEIKSVHNDLLTTGRIYTIKENNIEFIHPEDDKMPLIPYNTPVKISIFNAKRGFRMLMGTVFISTDVFLRVSDAQSLQDFERRGFFRMRVDIPSRIYLLEEEGAGDSEILPVDVVIEDISLSGVQVSLKRKLIMGEKFSIEVQLFKKKMMFHCRVTRVAREVKNERHFFGCAFFDQSERQIDDLCYDLFQLQRMEIRKHRS